VSFAHSSSVAAVGEVHLRSSLVFILIALLHVFTACLRVALDFGRPGTSAGGLSENFRFKPLVITRDNVSVKVNAACYFRVVDANLANSLLTTLHHPPRSSLHSRSLDFYSVCLPLASLAGSAGSQPNKSLAAGIWQRELQQ